MGLVLKVCCLSYIVNGHFAKIPKDILKHILFTVLINQNNTSTLTCDYVTFSLISGAN